MSYKAKITDNFNKQIRKLDKSVAKQVIEYIYKRIDGCDNPRAFGKALLENRKGQWRYRIGGYRLICEIQDEELIVLALEIGHRKDIYK